MRFHYILNPSRIRTSNVYCNHPKNRPDNKNDRANVSKVAYEIENGVYPALISDRSPRICVYSVCLGT